MLQKEKREITEGNNFISLTVLDFWPLEMVTETQVTDINVTEPFWFWLK